MNRQTDKTTRTEEWRRGYTQKGDEACDRPLNRIKRMETCYTDRQTDNMTESDVTGRQADRQ